MARSKALDCFRTFYVPSSFDNHQNLINASSDELRCMRNLVLLIRTIKLGPDNHVELFASCDKILFERKCGARACWRLKN